MAVSRATALSVTSTTGVLSPALTNCDGPSSQRRRVVILGASELSSYNFGRARGAQVQASSLWSTSAPGLSRCIPHSRRSKECSRPSAGPLGQEMSWNGKFLLSVRQSSLIQRTQPLKKQSRGVCTASMAGPGTVQVASNLFQLATAFVIPFYTVMILAPHSERTQKIMESELVYLVLGAGYIYLLALAWTPQTLGLMFSSKYWLPELSGITRMFASTLSVASAWLHLLAVDLFAGRQVFLDGVKHDIETRHSLVLCLMMCPIGIFCHLFTKSVVLFLRRARSEVSKEEPPKKPAVSPDLVPKEKTFPHKQINKAGDNTQPAAIPSTLRHENPTATAPKRQGKTSMGQNLFTGAKQNL